jgi:DNA repair protein RadC
MAYQNFVREVCVRSKKRKVTGSTVIDSAQDVARLCRDLEAETQEHFVVLCLDPRFVVTSRQTVSIGTIDSALAHPREVFRHAVMEGAYAIVLVHNHPTGDPTPSEPDIGVTQRMCEAGALLDIEVHDHVIVSDGGYFSFKEEAEKRNRLKMSPEEMLARLLAGGR